ncbi:hypothetical protein P7K49_029663 [Saguinus oedipus]|uniref:Clu domain-containing protein n=1 Tax=Saguinus oedipus TaxID=9490 RepID=A0ABQ9U7U7_SAGOE|nr:hypothetical protein P7K49_029663 [Saguinus oedipus]
MVAIDSSVTAISPSEETRMQRFMGKAIFFSLGFHIQYYYKDFGGDVAASTALTTDLNGGHKHKAVDTEGLCTLGMAMIDDHGYQLMAQSIIPGTPAWEQEQSFIFDTGVTAAYLELLDDHNEEVELCALKLVDAFMDKGEEQPWEAVAGAGMGTLGCSGTGSLKRPILESEEAILIRSPFPSPIHPVVSLPNAEIRGFALTAN